MRGFVGAVFGVLAMQTVGVVADAPTFDNCVGACGNNLGGDFGKYKCGSASDLACLCKNNDFLFAVRDSCTKTCNVKEDIIGNWVKTGPCAPFNVALPADKPETSSTQAQPKTTSSSAPPPPPTTSSSSSVSVASTPAATTQSSSTTSASATGVSTEAASTTASETSASSTAPATESTSAAAAAGGLSYASTVGIGVGVAAAVVAAGIVGFILLKNRKRKPAPRQSMDISKPLPGSGRTYPERERVRDSFEKYAADIEMTSNRYEDMVPRTQPRTMHSSRIPRDE